MKMIIVGAGGIGSYFIEWVCRCIDKEQIDPYSDITIADQDIVELDQKRYQNFNLNDVGKNKAKVLSERFKEYGIKAKQERIEKESQLKPFDLIILCVDNEKARDMVIRHCHKQGKDFLDLRANGRNIFAMPKEKSLEDNLKFVDSKDLKEYSCQDKSDLKKGRVQLGNEIIALWGCQMLLNLIRGHDNKIMSRVV